MASYWLDSPLHFVGNVRWIYPRHRCVQEPFKALRLVEVREVMLGQPLLDGLSAICIKLLANITATKGRTAAATNKIQKVWLRLCPVVEMAHATPISFPVVNSDLSKSEIV
jgi:hypothetical protein